MSEQLEQDGLYQLLITGKADAEAQQHAAEWIRWLDQFVPPERRQRRSDGYNTP